MAVSHSPADWPLPGLAEYGPASTDSVAAAAPAAGRSAPGAAHQTYATKQPGET